ncbi:DUF2470 domain-containing protein [Aldersonia sp. NBC_00410]|jgi:Domain of unknown function (DUF2470)|uniref:DUF2470 domain-containing protein n=1 Tax=Aldersonia sp. NBC_00410 TaxID=2975954 RepID=UPI00224D7B23|nr:DUF2470 domain-containing protein [Aldersonia sp. NBC_00410]MCX5042297.1 DUF2470 domain-containing protein [Aldersonia sp. NBC_00410]
MTRSIATDGPTTAERIHSACARAESSVLAIPGSDPVPTQLHRLRACGDAVIAIPTDSPATAMAWQSSRTGLPAVLELTDEAPLALREPVRSLVWLRGTVTAVSSQAERALAAEVAAEHPHPSLLDVGHGSTLLRLTIASAVVADTSGAESVQPDALRSANPDPFAEMEKPWLQHLDCDHPDVVERLARRLPTGMRRGRVRPLALDRFGLTLRVETADGDRDVRMPFNDPVTDFTELTKAIRILMGCPFLNGLRARG